LARLLEAQAQQERTLAARAQEEAAIYQALAEEAEQRAAQLQAQFDAQLQDGTARGQHRRAAALCRRAAQAARSVHLDEAATRRLIDAQLIEAGWQADTQQLTYAAGARPQRGRNLAIAEWPAPGQQAADYVLFAGLVPLATVEAKRRNINVAGKIGQAERYARGLQLRRWRHHRLGAAPAWPGRGQTGRAPTSRCRSSIPATAVPTSSNWPS
jgi:type I restriction enzyme R subunit